LGYFHISKEGIGQVKPNPSAQKLSQRLTILAMILIAAFSNHFTQKKLNLDRQTLGLTRMEPLKNAPPLLAFSSVALGGFRGLIANALWMRVTRLQDEGRFFETLSLADWITKLQPTFSSVWTFQSWNMTYNISKQFESPEERWRWIESGVRLLRDEALEYNPKSSEIYRELAWIFQDKIGGNLDAQHAFYKGQWAADMRRILGNLPDLNAIEQSQDPEVIAKREALLKNYGLDISRMRLIQENLGQYDWRLPETHAIYWAWAGLENANEGKLNFLRRIIWQSMNLAFERGRLIENQADQKLDYAPNLDLAPYTHAMFLKVRKDEEDPNYYSTIDRAHKEFLQNASYYFFLHHRLQESAQWFRELKLRYPDSLPQGISLEEFALNRFEANLVKADMNEARVIINGLIRQFLYFLAIGDEDQAMGYRNMSELAWKNYQQRVQRSSERLALPPYGELLKNMLERINQGEEGFSQAMIGALNTRVEVVPAAEGAQ
jgi:hypothetical protein